MNRTLPLAVVSLACCSVSATGFAAVAESTVTLDEIVVTAQKRDERLQDVPIAIVAVSGAAMESNAVRTLSDLASSVPNVHIGQAFAQGYLSIRGLASGINPGFESTVGQVIDGYFYPRDRFAYLSFLDVERIEILKGPQGALIGKNTTAGAVNITTVLPTNKPDASVLIERGFEGGVGWNTQGAASIPLSETFSARIVGRFEDSDGYMRNAFTGGTQPTHRDAYGRVALKWTPNDDLTVILRGGSADIHEHGRNIELIHCDAAFVTQLATRGLSQYEDCTPNWRTGENYGRPALGPGQYDLQTNQGNIANLTVSLQTRLGTLSSLTGFANFDYIGQESGLRTAINTRAVDLEEHWKQSSEEIRLVSNRGKRFDYIAGVYLLRSKQDTVNGISIFGPPAFSSYIYATAKSKTYSGFGNFAWHVTDTFDAILEGRYTREDKDGNPRGYNTQLFNPAAVTAATYNISISRGESNVSPGLKLVWHPNMNTMVYANAIRGFKGGGFNMFLNATDNATALPQAQFGPESTTAFELGTKLTLAGGKALLTVAAFHQSTDDLQVTSLIPSGQLAAFSVQNAAKATTYGLESELNWRPIEPLSLGVRAGYIHATYDKFPSSQCWRAQTVAQGCINGSQSLTGTNLPFAPQFSGSLQAEYVWTVAQDWRLSLYGEIQHSGAFQTEFSNDPLAILPSYQKYNAHIKLASRHVEFSLIGRNLGNQITYIGANSTNSSTGGTLAASIEPPRQTTLQVAYRY